MRWLWLDLRARARERTAWLAAGVLVYAVLALPVLLAAPPPHVLEALRGWFGSDQGFVLFLYLWTDVAMNKIVGLLAVVFAGQTLVRERDTGQLDLLRARPVTLARLFLVRAGSAMAWMACLYAGTVAVALPWFALRVEGFRPGVFLLSSLVHGFAALFAVAAAATLSVVIGRRTLGLVVSLVVLMSLIGASFMGFYAPELAWIAQLDPFAQGVSVVGHLADLRPRHVVAPIATLSVTIAATLAVGALAARRWEDA